MAARRLLILMLTLLAVSTLVAALIPPQSRRGDTTSTTSTTTTAPDSGASGGRLVREVVTPGGDGATTIPLRLGDQLALEVVPRSPDQVEIPALGLLEDGGPDAPARFDVLPSREGRYDVELVEAGRVVAVIRVDPKREAGQR